MIRPAFWPALLVGLHLVAADPPAVLWRDPGNVNLDDWICGPGGCGQAPSPPFHFEDEDSGGTSPKINVRDSQGRMWNVKFGPEVIPECFGSRFVNAVGYITEPTYYVACGRIDQPGKISKARFVIHKDGTFSRARFQRRGQPDFEFLKGRAWSWVNNPFVGTRELAGLKIVMMLLSNWDAKDSRDRDQSNNAVFRSVLDGKPVLLYSMYDWGASLGHWGGPFRRDRSDCSAYVADSAHFIHGVKGGQIEWGYYGKRSDDIKAGVTVQDVRWLLPYLQRITPEDLHAGLKASGTTDRQAACWARGIGERIQALKHAADSN
jgi:hypothetical protein